MGLLTSLKNFLQRIKWKKKHTKQSEKQPLRQNNLDLIEPIKQPINRDDAQEYIKLPDITNKIKENPFKDIPKTDAAKKLDGLIAKMHSDFMNNKSANEELHNMFNKMNNDFLRNRTIIDMKPTETAMIEVLSDNDKILDFINTMPDVLKKKALDSLSSTNNEHALFMSVLDEDNKEVYIILFNYLGDSIESLEPGLMLISSTNKDAICAMIAEMSNLTYEQAKKGFSGRTEEYRRDDN